MLYNVTYVFSVTLQLGLHGAEQQERERMPLHFPAPIEDVTSEGSSKGVTPQPQT